MGLELGFGTGQVVGFGEVVRSTERPGHPVLNVVEVVPLAPAHAPGRPRVFEHFEGLVALVVDDAILLHGEAVELATHVGHVELGA